jgi:hypothetical protein
MKYIPPTPIRSRPTIWRINRGEITGEDETLKV